MRKLLAIVLTALVASGCASGLTRATGDDRIARYEPYIGEPIDGFTAFRQDSWHPVARDKFILWTGINDAYLLTIIGTCPDLRFENRVAVTSTGSRITTFDQVRLRGHRCPIEEIRPVDVRQMKADRREREDSRTG